MRRVAKINKTYHDPSIPVENASDSGAATQKLLTVETAIIVIVKDLAQQLHLREGILKNISIQTSLDEDLGLDSLSRMELFSRVERRFAVSISPSAALEITSLNDIKKLVLNTGVEGSRRFIRKSEYLSLAEVETTPDSCKTLVDVLEWHVRSHADRPHIKLYSDTDEGEVITYGELYNGASAVTNGLRQYGLSHGDRVVIMLPTGKEYFYSFIGVLMAGCIPVSIYPPARLNQIEDHLKRHRKIVQNCAATILISFDRAKQVARLLKAHVPDLANIVTVEELLRIGSAGELPSVCESDIAFLQYTSGSTGQPKGVVLTHKNLLSNIRCMGEWLQANHRDVIVTWLPLYHDMGLIGCWLGSLYHSCLCVVMSPFDFLTRPERWLWALHRYKGSITAAPNFAYELCLKRIDDSYIEGLDLSSWRVALNGAEAVSPRTIANFTERFNRYGFRPETLMPVYGLAENTVALAFPPIGRKPVIDSIDREKFTKTGKAIPCKDKKNALEFVACGMPLRGNEIRVVDAMDKELPDREEGRLQFRSLSATSGYYNNEARTKELIRGDWWESGDKAYISNGDIYITGRIKDIIVHGGRNLYPEELEEAIGNIPGIRKGCVAVFGSRDNIRETEKLVVLAETRETAKDVRNKLQGKINSTSVEVVGAPPDEVLLTAPQTVLKTSSGKIRRSACKDLYEKGMIGQGKKSFAFQLLSLVITSFLPLARRSLRIFGSLFYATWFWGVFAFFTPIVWLSVFFSPKIKWTWKIGSFFGKIMGALLKLKCEILGAKQDSSPCIYVANHSSYLDAFALLVKLSYPVCFVAKAELKSLWFARIMLNRVGAVCVDRFDTQQSVEDAKRLQSLAKSGDSLLFFPEGTFTRVPGIYPFHMGAFITAVQANLPVVPVAINGTRSVLRPGSWFPRHGKVTITIGDKITLDEPSISDWEKAVLLRDQSRAFILHYSGDADLSHERAIPSLYAPTKHAAN